MARAVTKATRNQTVTSAVLSSHAKARISGNPGLKKGTKLKKANRNEDRLRLDIAYLNGLVYKIERRTDIDVDEVQACVSKEATEAVSLLREREAFWKLMG